MGERERNRYGGRERKRKGRETEIWNEGMKTEQKRKGGKDRERQYMTSFCLSGYACNMRS